MVQTGPGPGARAATDSARPRRVLRAGVAVLAGWLIYLSFAPRTWWWLAPAGLALLYAVLRGRSGPAGLGYGLLAGMSWMLPLLWWTGEYIGPLAPLALGVAQAGLVAVPAAAIAVVSRLPAGPLWSALVWVGGELLRASVPFGGFPWAKIAFSQPDGVYAPLAAVGGTALVGFAVALTGFAAAELSARALPRSFPRLEDLSSLTGPALGVLAPVLAALAAAALVGMAADAGAVTVAAVQGNVPSAGLDFNAQRRAVLDNHVERTMQLAADVRAGRVPAPDLVIWPENSSDIDPYRNPDAHAAISRAARAVQVPVVVGAVVADPSGPRNTAIVWDPVAGPTHTYTKRRLQPFGETMPWPSFFRLFSANVDRAGQFVPGTTADVLPVGPARVAVTMCYEVAFDAEVRASVTNQSTLLAVPSNNATFGFTDMTYQQLAMDRVRAVEHSRSVVVATTSGVSALIRPDGTVTTQTTLFTPAAIVDTLPLRTSITIADRLGPWPERLMVAAALTALAAAAMASRIRPPFDSLGVKSTNRGASLLWPIRTGGPRNAEAEQDFEK